jgi:uncharacterized membrane protein SpoIIM required for sporulation
MPDLLAQALHTLGDHVGPALWAMAVFACGFALAFPVVRFDVRSLLIFPAWLLRLAKKYLRPELSPAFLFAFIFAFNTVAIFAYMLSGAFVLLPLVFDLLTGLNVGAVMLIDAREALAERREGSEPEPEGGPAPPRAWVGFCSLFVVVVELSAFWLAIGMGMKLGHYMRQDFTWATFLERARPRVLAYLTLIVPALAASALAETAAIKAMLTSGRSREAPSDGES